jgi:hypothetical protein
MADFTPQNTEIVSPKEFTIEDVNLYTEHMDYYFDVQLNETMKNFTEDELQQMFQLFHDYAGLIKKMIHAKIPLVEYILGNPWPPEEILNDPKFEHLQIKDYNHWMIEHYEEWKKSKGL